MPNSQETIKRRKAMHIAVVSLGAFGHVNPTLSFVTELVKRGVRVTYFTTEDL